MAERKFGRKKRRLSYDSNGAYSKEEKISEKINDLTSMASFETDPFGSYTGVPEDIYEVPIQDADDL